VWAAGVGGQAVTLTSQHQAQGGGHHAVTHIHTVGDKLGMRPHVLVCIRCDVAGHGSHLPNTDGGHFTGGFRTENSSSRLVPCSLRFVSCGAKAHNTLSSMHISLLAFQSALLLAADVHKGDR